MRPAFYARVSLCGVPMDRHGARAGVRGSSESPAAVTPQSFMPKAGVTPTRHD